jgi:hypothetical protein
MLDNQASAGHVSAPQIGETARGAAAKVRRYRARKKAGIIVASVEITPELLEFLAWGKKTPVETLKGDRAQLTNAILCAIAKLLRDLQRRGKYPG